MDKNLHELLNAPRFSTDLFLPRYKNVEKENWRITHMGLGFDHGYFSDVWVVENMPILLRRNKDDRNKWESWMSICPHELESQELCCKYAYGTVVIMGLGMGWVAINTAFNPKVEKVFVIDIDEEVINVFYECGAVDEIPDEIKNKIIIVKDDALTYKPKEKIDFLYVDIWKNLVEPQTLDDVGAMQKNINADKIYFWGQELFFFRELQSTKLTEDKMGLNFLNNITLDMKLPLLLPKDIDYPSMVIQAGKQRLKRRLPLER